MWLLRNEYPILRKLVGWIFPEPIRIARRCLKILEIDYGHIYTTKSKSAINKQGKPIPWFTYPAIEYIKQLDLADKVIFEYGSGNSTLFWGSRCQEVKSVEDNEEWYKKILEKVEENTEIKLEKDKAKYVKSISSYKENFDVIVIDGRARYDCAVEAIKKLKPGGLIILDNSNWYVRTTQLLREANFIQADMAGFVPITWEISVTSFFFHREFNFSPKNANQPKGVIGSIKKPYKGGDTPGEAFKNS